MIVLQAARERIDQLYFARRGTTLLVPSSKGVYLWSDVSVERQPILLAGVNANSIQFIPDSERMIFEGGQVSIRGSSGEEEEVLHFREKTPDMAEVGVSPDGRFLVAARSDYFDDDQGRLVCRVLDARTVDIWSVTGVHRFPTRPLFLPKGDRFVSREWWNGETGFEHGPAWITRDLQTGQVVSEYCPQGNGFRTVIQSADRSLIAGVYVNSITIYRTEDLAAPIATFKNDSKKDFTGAAFHPGGRFLAATSNDNTVKLYDTATWKRAESFNWEIGRLRSIAFSADGNLAAAGGDKGQIVLWDVEV